MIKLFFIPFLVSFFAVSCTPQLGDIENTSLTFKKGSSENKQIFKEAMSHLSIVTKTLMKLTTPEANIPLSENNTKLLEVLKADFPTCVISYQEVNSAQTWTSQNCPFSYTKALTTSATDTNDKDFLLQFFITQEELKKYINFFDISLNGQYRKLKIENEKKLHHWIQVDGSIKASGLDGDTLGYKFQEYSDALTLKATTTITTITYKDTIIVAQKSYPKRKKSKNSCVFDSIPTDTRTYSNLVEQYKYSYIHPLYHDKAFSGSIEGPCGRGFGGNF